MSVLPYEPVLRSWGNPFLSCHTFRGNARETFQTQVSGPGMPYGQALNYLPVVKIILSDALVALISRIKFYAGALLAIYKYFSKKYVDES